MTGIVFDLLINALVFGTGYRRIADQRGSPTTIRCRRDEWGAAGVMDHLEHLAREGYDQMIGLDLDDVAVDVCLTKAPCEGEVAGKTPPTEGISASNAPPWSTPADYGWGGQRAREPARLPLLAPTLDLLKDLGPLPERTCVHLDAGYDCGITRALLADAAWTRKSGPRAHRQDVSARTVSKTDETPSDALARSEDDHRRVMRHVTSRIASRLDLHPIKRYFDWRWLTYRAAADMPGQPSTGPTSKQLGRRASGVPPRG